jgi:hypothetical protein
MEEAQRSTESARKLVRQNMIRCADINLLADRISKTLDK